MHGIFILCFDLALPDVRFASRSRSMERRPKQAMGRIVMQMVVTGERLYQLIRQRDAITDHTFEIRFLDSGVEAYAFTFG